MFKIIVPLFIFFIVATTNFVINYSVIGLENEQKTIVKKMNSDQKAIQVLEAELAFLSNPKRIRALSKSYNNMKPLTQDNMISFQAIPFKSIQGVNLGTKNKSEKSIQVSSR
ncbi:MAG: hypothetical protein MJ247_00345 [Alphaproteobacteria bacterium]|nr:hypothetical protein [Alphaproteobacteria bacterium]